MKEVKNNKTKSPVLAANLIVLGLFGIFVIIGSFDGGIVSNPGWVALFIGGVFYLPSVILFNIVAYFVKRKTQSKFLLTLLFFVVMFAGFILFWIGVLIVDHIQSKKPRQESEACLKAWASKDGIQLKSFAESPIYNEQGKIKGLKIDLEIQNDTEHDDGLEVWMSSGPRLVSIGKKIGPDDHNSIQTINNLKPYQLNKVTYILDRVSFYKHATEGRENEKLVFRGNVRLVAGGIHIFSDPRHPDSVTDRKCDYRKGRDDTEFVEVLRPFPMTSREYKVSDFVETPGIIQ